MLIYNITSKVDHKVHASWLGWMEQTYLPDLLETTLISDYHLTRLLSVDDSEGPTYALLITFSKRADFKVFEEKHQVVNEQVVRTKWGNGVLSFASKLDVVIKRT
jgi:hypothetical protein